MSDFRRRQTMAACALPYDAELEYLESTGTQYIDTGITTVLVDRVVGEVEFLQLGSNTRYVVGGRNGSTSSATARGFALYASAHNGFQFYPDGWKNSAGVSVNLGQSVMFDTTIKDGLQEFIVDGVVRYTATESLSDAVGSNKISIFALLSGGTTQYYSKVRLKGRLSLYYDGSLVRDFIPVRVGQVGYMYDRVSGQLFGNDGTGDFILGNDIT